MSDFFALVLVCLISWTLGAWMSHRMVPVFFSGQNRQDDRFLWLRLVSVVVISFSLFGVMNQKMIPYALFGDSSILLLWLLAVTGGMGVLVFYWLWREESRKESTRKLGLIWVLLLFFQAFVVYSSTAISLYEGEVAVSSFGADDVATFFQLENLFVYIHYLLFLGFVGRLRKNKQVFSIGIAIHLVANFLLWQILLN